MFLTAGLCVSSAVTCTPGPVCSVWEAVTSTRSVYFQARSAAVESLGVNALCPFPRTPWVIQSGGCPIFQHLETAAGHTLGPRSLHKQGRNPIIFREKPQVLKPPWNQDPGQATPLDPPFLHLSSCSSNCTKCLILTLFGHVDLLGRYWEVTFVFLKCSQGMSSQCSGPHSTQDPWSHFCAEKMGILYRGQGPAVLTGASTPHFCCICSRRPSCCG